MILPLFASRIRTSYWLAAGGPNTLFHSHVTVPEHVGQAAHMGVAGSRGPGAAHTGTPGDGVGIGVGVGDGPLEGAGVGVGAGQMQVVWDRQELFRHLFEPPISQTKPAGVHWEFKVHAISHDGTGVGVGEGPPQFGVAVTIFE